MADPAGTHSDGSILWGTQVVAIPTTSGSNYTANDIKVDFGTDVFGNKNISGVAQNEVMIEQPFEGTLTLQLLNANIPVPPIGSKFAITGPNAAAYNCKVSKAGVAYKIDGETLVDISFRKQLN